MTDITQSLNAKNTTENPPESLWRLARHRLKQDKIAMGSLAVVCLFLIMIVLSFTGVIAKNWDQEVAVSYAPPTFLYHSNEATSPNLNSTLQSTENVDWYGVSDPLAPEMQSVRDQLKNQADTKTELAQSLPFGADRWGQDVIQKTIKGSETSILVGIISALLAVVIGTILGAVSGYFGGWLDDVVNWFYNVFTSIPYMLLILAIAAVLNQKGMTTIILILGVTGWTGTYRLVRAEYMKHKEREYVSAAKAIGVSHIQRMFVHIFPNVSHIALVQMSILVVSFIKSEVILSFLGFGVPVGTVSWGSMLNEAQSEFIIGKWWQLIAATTAMAILVTAFSLFTDALRDALDPKSK